MQIASVDLSRAILFASTGSACENCAGALNGSLVTQGPMSDGVGESGVSNRLIRSTADLDPELALLVRYGETRAVLQRLPRNALLTKLYTANSPLDIHCNTSSERVKGVCTYTKKAEH